MNCPRCDVSLEIEDYKGIEVDACPNCEGRWLDHHEMDELEDEVLDDDSVKGTMMYAKRQSAIACPRCGKTMTTFNYRAYNLPIDYCPDEHGFWLDPGEEKRVLELMKQRIKDLNRSASAEVEWGKFLNNLGSSSFTDKLKGLFKR